jgi:hypothetical protein
LSLRTGLLNRQEVSVMVAAVADTQSGLNIVATFVNTVLATYPRMPSLLETWFIS